jgi:alkylation response protein AidB-like acyl-CoA dehydrogenase
MDLELTDEQVWLSESIDTLLDREWVPPELAAEVTAEQRRRVWERLVEFGALTIGGEEGLGAVELCLIARSLGSHVASTPFLGSAGLRLAVAALDEPPPISEHAIALAVLDHGSSWAALSAATTLHPANGCGRELRGHKVAVEQWDAAERIAVLATLEGQPTLALVASDAAGLRRGACPSFDPTVPLGALRFDGVEVQEDDVVRSEHAVERLMTAGALLAAAEAIGAAGAVLELARAYAGERRQFGRTIASFQALRHILADAYVRQASGWSTVLYAAAAFDDGADDAAQAASVAKAYVSRGAREVAHHAMQVFGGIAFTAEHPAHRFLRRIVVREQQFGDAAHHERALGRELARRTEAPAVMAQASAR